MRLLRIIEGKPMRRYGHVSGKNEQRIPDKVLNMRVIGKHPRERPRSGWEQQVRKNVIQKEEKKEGKPQEEAEEEEELGDDTDKRRGVNIRRP
jgi:hypothetical protein